MQRYAAAHALEGKVRCSSGVGLPFRSRSPDFFCVVGVGTGRCDELRATYRARVWVVSRYRRDVDCVLPA